jgi:hypothetical protein
MVDKKKIVGSEMLSVKIFWNIVINHKIILLKMIIPPKKRNEKNCEIDIGSTEMKMLFPPFFALQFSIIYQFLSIPFAVIPLSSHYSTSSFVSCCVDRKGILNFISYSYSYYFWNKEVEWLHGIFLRQIYPNSKVLKFLELTLHGIIKLWIFGACEEV